MILFAFFHWFFDRRVFIDADKKMYMPYLKSIMGIPNKEIEIVKEKENKVVKTLTIIPRYYGLNRQKPSNIITTNNPEKSNLISSGVEVEVEDEVEDFCLLNDGAMILIDNTLWKGLVLSQVTQSSYLFFLFLFYSILSISSRLVFFLNSLCFFFLNSYF
jgi:hypothetical protein